ncbi:MAG TPA: hypothetical protein PLP29_10030 [Candidatus Ozemobacteraceae bacterium]|nr:hypothetical protein [Candidatus Ozemobacteraceae bacterium]
MRWIFVLTAAFAFWGAVRKPAFFWEHHKAKAMRGLFGDVGATIVYVVIALFLLLVGVFGPVR